MVKQLAELNGPNQKLKKILEDALFNFFVHGVQVAVRTKLFDLKPCSRVTTVFGRRVPRYAG
jgi:hypothetical protein